MGRWTILGVACAWLLTGTGCERVPESSGPLPQDVYVWQRSWTPGVVDAVRVRAPEFGRLIVLAGEVGWKSGRPVLTRVQVDHGVLGSMERSPGLALRIGSYAGPFRADDDVARDLGRYTREILEEARTSGVVPSEFQVDFDCAESRLGGYRAWVTALKEAAGPTPLVITALPSWLGRREFGDLARTAGSFVLQVHSVERPSGPDAPFQLCDPGKAERWVREAARLGVPFRVALPTYGYLVAFDRTGKFLGASAEGWPPARPEGSQLREIGADPVALGQRVADWTRHRPAMMTGLIWYRLPVEGERLNWRWPTLAAVKAGRSPQWRLASEAVPTKGARGPAPIEIRLRNDGEADFHGAVGVRVRDTGRSAPRLVARDGIRGFEVLEAGIGENLFTNAICRLPVGETLIIGWMRFDAEVSLECHPIPVAPVSPGSGVLP